MQVGDLIKLSESWQGSGFIGGDVGSGIIVAKQTDSSATVSVLWSSGDLTERCPLWMLEMS
jgi:hypothetical protein